MIKIVLFLFLIGHVTGDFYLQSDELATDKNESFGKLLKHSVIYLFSLIIVIIPVFSLSLLRWSSIIALAHFAVDLVKFFLKKKTFTKSNLDVWAYFLDQLVHFLVIIAVTLVIHLNSESIAYIYPLRFLMDRITIDVMQVLSWLLLLLVVIQPFSITIKKVLYRYRPLTSEEKGGQPNAGAFIGILERLIILLLLSVGQYAAIGFVLTAKSIARYNKIAENPEFSEYYLLGTLLSAMLVISAYLIIF